MKPYYNYLKDFKIGVFNSTISRKQRKEYLEYLNNLIIDSKRSVSWHKHNILHWINSSRSTTFKKVLTFLYILNKVHPTDYKDKYPKACELLYGVCVRKDCRIRRWGELAEMCKQSNDIFRLRKILKNRPDSDIKRNIRFILINSIFYESGFTESLELLEKSNLSIKELEHLEKRIGKDVRWAMSKVVTSEDEISSLKRNFDIFVDTCNLLKMCKKEETK